MQFWNLVGVICVASAVWLYPLSLRGQTFSEWLKKGEAELERREFAAALLSFNRAMQSDSAVVWKALVKRGYARLNLQDTLGALQDYAHAIGLARKEPDAYFYRAMLRLSQKDYPRAVADLSAVLLLNPKLPAALYYRALAKFHLGELDEALQDLEEAIKLESNFADAYSLRGLCYAAKENDTLAINAFTQALRIRAAAEDYYQRGWARWRLRRALEAMIDLDNAIALNANEAKYYFARALAKRDAGMRSEAFTDFLTARAKGYEDAEKYLKLYGVSEEKRREDSLRIYGVREIVVEANAPAFETFVRETRTIAQQGVAIAQYAAEQLNAGFAPVVLPNASLEMSPNECNKMLLQVRRPSQIPIQCIAQLLREQASKTNDATIKDISFQLTTLVREMDIARQMPLAALEVRTRLLDARKLLQQLNDYLASKQKTLR